MISEHRKTQLTQLYILLEVKRICEKHNLKYFLDGGTLLGATRHHGFIPWDDDIDIGMPRKDFERFIEVCSYELSNDFFLQTKETDYWYSSVANKIRLNGTERLDAGAKNAKAHSGIDIDIFPFDNFPSSSLKQWSYYNVCWFLRCLLDVKSNGILLNHENSMKKKIGWGIGKIIAYFLSREKICKMIDVHFQKYDTKETKFVISSAGSYHYKKQMIPCEMIENLDKLTFENVKFPVPGCYSKYLSSLYGNDYMEIPPKDKQIQHAILKLDLGKYSDIVSLIHEKYGVSLNVENK